MTAVIKRLLPPAALALVIALVVNAYSGGPPVRRTGAPGDQTCLDAGCHVGERFANSSSVRLETPRQLTYIPGGGRQRWTLSIQDPNARAFGFQMTARLASDSVRLPGGLFTAVDASTQVICENDRLADVTGCPAASPLQFLQHNQPRPAGEFAFEWTPPATDVGEVAIYVAANASVTGQRNSRIHFRRFVVRPAVTSGVVDAASLRPTIASGAWATVFGTGLSSSTRSWRPDEIVGDMLPTTLDGVAVRVNGLSAAIHYVSPTQVNFQVPDIGDAGPAQVEVSRDGRLIARLEARKAPIGPALFVYHDGGRNFAAAVHADGSLVTTAAPARAGETVLLFGTGFGPTDPPVPSGRLVSRVAELKSRVRARVGTADAAVTFAGLVSAGLYQLNVVVPESGADESVVQIEIAGQTTQEDVYLPVSK